MPARLLGVDTHYPSLRLSTQLKTKQNIQAVVQCLVAYVLASLPNIQASLEQPKAEATGAAGEEATYGELHLTYAWCKTAHTSIPA